MKHTTLAAAVQKRLRSLPPDARVVLDAMSVLGDTDSELLTVLTQIDDAKLSTAIHQAVSSTLLVSAAQHRLSITSPYFVPEQSLLYAITTAAQRGVDVELFVGEQGDQFMVHHAQCSYYRPLLEAGVRIYFYPAPFVLHSEHFSIDDHTAVIGSSNMDIRSFNLDFEISMMCTGSPTFITHMREVEDMYRSLSREMTLTEWKPAPSTNDGSTT